jgi:hypothetical protein
MRVFMAILLFSSLLFGVEFRVGKVTYRSDLKILDFMDCDMSYDTLVFGITLPRYEIADKLFFYGDFDYHTSDTKKSIIYFNNIVANYDFPVVGSANDRTNDILRMSPVDGDFKGLGFDLNFGFGYDLFKNDNSYLAIAINSGASLPTISAKNIKQRAKFAYKMIKKWDLDVGTYKIGPSLRAEMKIDDLFEIYSSVGFGFQKAYIDSDLFKSSVDSKGSYTNFDIGFKISPQKLPKNLKLTFGYIYKKWSVDSVDVNLYNFFEADVMRPFDMDLSSKYGYVGVEYKF